MLLEDGDCIDADVVVIAMGPWSGSARAYLPKLPPVTGSNAQSVVLQPPREFSAHAIFTHVSLGGAGLSRTMCIV